MTESAAVTEQVAVTESAAISESTGRSESVGLLPPARLPEPTPSTESTSVQMEPVTRADIPALVAMDMKESAAPSQRVDRVTCTEEVLRLEIELANERAARASERAATAIERESNAVQRAAEAERWSSMCETRMSVTASDADRALKYAVEATRCVALVREAELRETALLASVEQRCRAESMWCQALCQEAAQRVAFETERRIDAEERAAAIEQSVGSTMEQQISAVRHEA